jgi:hypothetical protein
MGKWGKKAHGEMTVAKHEIAVESTQKLPRTCFSTVLDQYAMHLHATHINMDAEIQMIYSEQQK